MAVLACAVVAGCTDPPPEEPASSPTASSPTPAASEDATPSPSAAEAEDTAAEETGSEETEVASPSPSASSTAGSDVTSASRSLAIEQRHPNGSVLRLTSLEVEANAITVGIEVVNGSGRDFDLGAGGAEVRLTDDIGGVFEFVEPVDDPDLNVPARGTLTGEPVYFGVVNPEATTLRLQTNASTGGVAATEVYDPADDPTNEPFPHFSVEIPLAP